MQSCFSEAGRNGQVLHLPIKSAFEREFLLRVFALIELELETSEGGFSFVAINVVRAASRLYVLAAMSQSFEWFFSLFNAKDPFRQSGPRAAMKTSIAVVSLAFIILLIAGNGFGYVHPGSTVRSVSDKSEESFSVTIFDH